MQHVDLESTQLQPLRPPSSPVKRWPGVTQQASAGFSLTCYSLCSGASASTSSSSSSDSDSDSGAARGQRISKSHARGRGAADGVERVEWRGRAGKLARIAQHEAMEAARLTALLEGGDKKQAAAGKAGGSSHEQEAKTGPRGAHAGRGEAAGGGNKRIVVTLSVPDGLERAEVGAREQAGQRRRRLAGGCVC